MVHATRELSQLILVDLKFSRFTVKRIRALALYYMSCIAFTMLVYHRLKSNVEFIICFIFFVIYFAPNCCKTLPIVSQWMIGVSVVERWRGKKRPNLTAESIFSTKGSTLIKSTLILP